MTIYDLCHPRVSYQRLELTSKNEEAVRLSDSDQGKRNSLFLAVDARPGKYELAARQANASGARCAPFCALFIMRLPKNFKTRAMIGAATMVDLKQKYDASTVAVMRQALNEVVTDRRFLVRKSVTTLEVAEHILQQAASGERDLNRLKSAAFAKLSAAA